MDEPHAPLEQSPAEQALPTEEIGLGRADAVEGPHRRALASKVEGLGRLPLHPEGQFEGGDPRVERGGVGDRALPNRVEPLQRVEHRTLHPVPGTAGEIGDRMIQIADTGALVGARQEARGPQLGPLEHLRRTHHHEPRQVLVLGAQPIDQPGTHAGPREGLFTGAHLEGGAGVVDVVGDHGADDAEVVDAGGRPRQQFAHLDPRSPMAGEAPRRTQQVTGLGPLQARFLEGQRLAVVDGQARLRIEEIDVARPPGHVQEEDSAGLRGVMGTPRGERMDRAIGRQPGSAGLGREQVGQGEQPQASARAGEEVPPG